MSPANRNLFPRNCEKNFISSGNTFKKLRLQLLKVRGVADPDVVHSNVHNLVLQSVRENLLFLLPPKAVIVSNGRKDGIALGELVSCVT